MSFISHLSIQGIRSFNSEDAETIEFKSPLTLICGSNGCGKTTIIECLKYATTGILPPNSKGGAFVHDPDLSHRQMTNAQIKLGFLSVQGQLMLVSRTMSLTKKSKDKVMFKTIETQLSTINNRERTLVSNNAAIVDAEVSNYLGVSKHILDYVIFCHQDESLWPLSEPSILKKKFDDIFQASQYTKILDTFKVINKEMAVDIKLLEKSVEYLNNDKTRAHKLDETLQDLQQQVEVLNTNIQQMEQQKNIKERELQEIFDSNQEFQATLSRYDQLSYTKTTLTQQINRLKTSIEIYPDSLEELTKKLNSFNDLTEQHAKEIQLITELKQELEHVVNDKRSQLSDMYKLQGSLSTKKTEYEENISVLTQEPKIIDISKVVEELETEVNDHQTKSKSIKEERTKKLQNLTESIANQKNVMKMKSDTKQELIMKIKHLEDKIRTSDMNEDSLRLAESELTKLTKKYQDASSSKFIEELTLDINKNEDKLTELEAELETLNERIQIVNEEREISLRIDHLKELNEQKSIAINSSMAKLNKVLNVTKDNFESEFNKELSSRQKQYNELKSRNNNLIEERNTLTTLIESNNTLYDELSQKLEETKARILKVIEELEIHEYDTIMGELEEDFRISFESLNTYEISKQFKIKAIEIGEKTHNCVMCHRLFGDEELGQFLESMKSDITRTNEEFQQSYEEAKKDLDRHKAIATDIVTYKALMKEIGQCELKKSQLGKSFSELMENVNVSTANLQQSHQEFKNIDELSSTVSELIKDFTQSQNNSEKISNLAKEASGSLGDESIDILNRTQQNKRTELKNLRLKHHKDTELKYQKERELSKLAANVKDKEIEIKNIESSLNDLKQAQSMMEEYQQQINGINEHIGDIESQLQRLIIESNKQQSDNESVFKELDTKETELTNKFAEAKDKLNTIKKLTEAVQMFETHDKSRIEENDEDIAKTNDEITAIGNQIEEHDKNLRVLEKNVHESSNVKSTIRDNIDYKTYVKDLEALEQEIIDLNVEEASKKKQQFLTETQRLNTEITNLNADTSGRLGQVKQLNEHMKSLEDQLNSEYKDIEQRYSEEWIKLQINLFVSNDITTYAKSLDNAIMKYHSLKMSEINKILKDLWIRTYKGSDIDYIAVKSDVSTQAKGRSYNYRVVMQKGGKELDMRGRCSAGQKVLTCILIRLALAECFGSNCGMIALDEPTTNLDVENAEGLAMALNELIRTRKYQKNFQLIIITHDMDFLSHINGRNFIDNFYKVSKDELLYSRINSYPIQVLGEE